MLTTDRPFGTLYALDSDVAIRAATEKEETASIEASMDNDDLGIITVDGERCYVGGN